MREFEVTDSFRQLIRNNLSERTIEFKKDYDKLPTLPVERKITIIRMGFLRNTDKIFIILNNAERYKIHKNKQDSFLESITNVCYLQHLEGKSYLPLTIKFDRAYRFFQVFDPEVLVE